MIWRSFLFLIALSFYLSPSYAGEKKVKTSGAKQAERGRSEIESTNIGDDAIGSRTYKIKKEKADLKLKEDKKKKKKKFKKVKELKMKDESSKDKHLHL